MSVSQANQWFLINLLAAVLALLAMAEILPFAIRLPGFPLSCETTIPRFRLCQSLPLQLTAENDSPPSCNSHRGRTLVCKQGRQRDGTRRIKRLGVRSATVKEPTAIRSRKA